MRKVRNQDCYKVTNQLTKKVHSKCTTKEKAQKQLRLLRAIEHNPKFVPRASKKKPTLIKIS
jgi:hypothetical protein